MAGVAWTSQWTAGVAVAASGSSTMSTKLWVPAGGSVHDKPGETLAPLQAYFTGIAPSGSKAVLVSGKPWVGCGLAAGVDCARELTDCETIATKRKQAKRSVKNDREFRKRALVRIFWPTEFAPNCGYRNMLRGVGTSVKKAGGDSKHLLGNSSRRADEQRGLKPSATAAQPKLAATGASTFAVFLDGRGALEHCLVIVPRYHGTLFSIRRHNGAGTIRG